MLNAIVIVGAGQAGFQTAASLRQDGFAGSITLVGDEAGMPYQRPPLSKAYLLGKTDAPGLLFRPEKFFADHRIDLVNSAATALDRTNRRVSLADGNALPYDHLVLATGAHNRSLPVPGAELDGVFGLKNLGDADALATRLGEIENVVVIGAGFIGLEFAAVARANGKNVHVVELADRPMARAVSKEMAEFFADAHRDWGVMLDFGQGLSRIDGERGRVTAVELTNGRRLPADLVVFGIGVLPNAQLACEAGLDIENGIKVDSYLLTSDPAISAIGDCAMFPSQHAGSFIRLESVQNAADQGRAVAARLVGKGAPYAAVPWFWTDQGDLKLQMVGLSAGHDATVRLGDPATRSFSILLFHRGRLIAVESVNRPGDFMAARKILSSRATPRWEEAASDGFDLRAWEAANR
ncbi:FAD-dependent oxidoreductase [Pseudaminobacter sp. 19-2017]|uniref:FAD-dependent oxidoreductase n=1 Tax=Pseudaminobacter soli (ex Zhang et al. 2022) TaxID=2831468 RepID=A0A942E234_9HYPH|nr:FAD-dependent oxidoreductase [Pseudaminobacter soli]MBS3652021.1 FAD-dependent oxidoreductase [Pseudaminobacter soli]